MEKTKSTRKCSVKNYKNFYEEIDSSECDNSFRNSLPKRKLTNERNSDSDEVFYISSDSDKLKSPSKRRLSKRIIKKSNHYESPIDNSPVLNYSLIDDCESDLKIKLRISSKQPISLKSFSPKIKTNRQTNTPRKSKRLSSVKSESTPKTPRNKMKLLREGNLTPSAQSRERHIKLDSTPLAKARNLLHVSHLPNILPCREKEFSDIYHFIEGKLLDGCGGCMYISGVPGTGKTATVTSVLHKLSKSACNEEIPLFYLVFINGLKLTEPRQTYVEIYKQITGKTLPWEQAYNILEEKFLSKKKSKDTSDVIVLLIDELDMLCTKRQDVIYNLLDWPSKSNVQLIVITIANTMDLPERLLMNKVTSRLGLTRLTFQPYTFKQLEAIVTKRLMGTNSFNPDAVQLVSRKVASVSGDARRALDICRKATEIAECEDKNAFVTLSHINKALNSMMTQPKVEAIKHCSKLEQLILQSVVAETERTGVEETIFSDVYKMFSSIATLNGFNHSVNPTTMLSAVARLNACRLLLTDHKYDISQKIILNVSTDDVFYALKTD